MYRVALALALLAGTAAADDDVRIWQTKDPSITEGETLITGDPATVYATMIDYTKWPEIFPDVAKVIVNAQKGVEARVTLVSPTGHRDNLHFQNQPKARMVFFEDTGNHGRAEAWAEIVFIPGDTAGTTRVHVRMLAAVHGIASIVVSDDEVRRRREAKITGDLTAMHNYFRKR